MLSVGNVGIYLTILVALTPIVIAFEISHLYVPTIDITEDMNNKSGNSDLSTISDDLIYLDVGQRNEFAFSSASLGNTNNKIGKSANSVGIEEKSPTISEVGAAVEVIADESKESDDLIKVNTNAHNKRLTDLVVADDCSSAEKSSEESSHKENESAAEAINHIDTPRIDMSDFIAIIPAVQVKSIFRDYYRQDKEVQRAYTYLHSKDFYELKTSILSVPEVNDFLKFLNKSGLDILNLLQTLIDLVGDPTERSGELNDGNRIQNNVRITTGAEENLSTGNEERIDGDSKIYEEQVKENTNHDYQSDEVKNSTNSMNGLHGLIDSILDILPQDQIISTFFDKLEDYEFATLVYNVGNDEFSRILQKMQSSTHLRHLVYTLHNNGIYIERIVDSLKGYFFLGGF